MSDLERLELLLRRHGFLVGRMTAQDNDSVEKLLKDIWAWFDKITEEQSA